MRLKEGNKVEVLTNTEGICLEFRCARIISGNGRTYSVQYDSFSTTTEASTEKVPRKAIRPCPPVIKGVESWAAHDVVEVYYDGSWNMATVLKVMGGDFYLVRLLVSCKELMVHKVNMRVRQSWINGQWIVKQLVPGSFVGGKSSCSLISSSDKVMPEFRQSGACMSQQAGTSMSQQASNDYFPGFDANNLQEPRPTSSAKRVSPYRPFHPEAYPKKIRAVTNTGECEIFKMVSTSPLPEKVDDAIAYPQNNKGQKCMYASFANVGTNQYYDTGKRNRSNVTDTADFLERINESDYSCSNQSSVGSCSVISSSPRKNYSGTFVGPFDDDDTLCSDAESLDIGDVDKGCPISPKEDEAERIHRLELHAYRSTLHAVYASGPLSWEQEELLTNLRISLHISNDEHLMEGQCGRLACLACNG